MPSATGCEVDGPGPKMGHGRILRQVQAPAGAHLSGPRRHTEVGPAQSLEDGRVRGVLRRARREGRHRLQLRRPPGAELERTWSAIAAAWGPATLDKLARSLEFKP